MRCFRFQKSPGVYLVQPPSLLSSITYVSTPRIRVIAPCCFQAWLSRTFASKSSPLKTPSTWGFFWTIMSRYLHIILDKCRVCQCQWLRAELVLTTTADSDIPGPMGSFHHSLETPRNPFPKAPINSCFMHMSFSLFPLLRTTAERMMTQKTQLVNPASGFGKRLGLGRVRNGDSER